MALNHDYIPEKALNRLHKLIDGRGDDYFNDTYDQSFYQISFMSFKKQQKFFDKTNWANLTRNKSDPFFQVIMF